MRKILFFVFITLFGLHFAPASAQPDMFDAYELSQDVEQTDSTKTITTDNISENDYLQEYIDDMETAQKAQKTAGSLLEQKPQIIRLRDGQKRLIKEGEEKRKQIVGNLAKMQENKQIEQIEQSPETTPEEKAEIFAQQIHQKYEAAPFGLFWGISKEQARQLGFILQPAERENYQDVNLLKNPKQKMQTFDVVTAIFGLQDKLWCIFAQSRPQNDAPDAGKVKHLYQKYYQALEKKYGNARQYFTPNTYTKELIEGEGAEQITKTVTENSEIWNDNFLQELQDGSAVLYATFENEELGITLGVSVDGEGKSYISIDYKNLQIMHEEQQTKLENIISDL